MADLPSRRLLAVALVGGVVVPGLLHYWLNAAGFGLLADGVWVGGYAAAVLAVWYGWLRPMDITGPSG